MHSPRFAHILNNVLLKLFNLRINFNLNKLNQFKGNLHFHHKMEI